MEINIILEMISNCKHMKRFSWESPRERIERQRAQEIVLNEVKYNTWNEILPQ